MGKYTEKFFGFEKIVIFLGALAAPPRTRQKIGHNTSSLALKGLEDAGTLAG